MVGRVRSLSISDFGLWIADLKTWCMGVRLRIQASKEQDSGYGLRVPSRALRVSHLVNLPLCILDLTELHGELRLRLTI